MARMSALASALATSAADAAADRGRAWGGGPNSDDGGRKAKHQHVLKDKRACGPNDVRADGGGGGASVEREGHFSGRPGAAFLAVSLGSQWLVPANPAQSSRKGGAARRVNGAAGVALDICRPRNGKFSASKSNQSIRALTAESTTDNCPAKSDSIPGPMRSNSSRQPHAPLIASPRSNAAEVRGSSRLEQLRQTTHCPRAVPSSVTVAVFPTPSLPAHAPPMACRRA
eukprot:scaffold33956_cov29-Tisochrysis_lutea.AAC.2